MILVPKELARNACATRPAMSSNLVAYGASTQLNDLKVQKGQILEANSIV